MSDQELKLGLARLLPEKIKIHPQGFYWHDSKNGFILETEWLHVCWLIEQGMSAMEYSRYFHLITVRASWQQRATAILKVKGGNGR